MFTTRERWLIVYNQSVEAWCERYGIILFEWHCEECGRDAPLVLPFACGDLRGVAAKPCECGNRGTPYCVVAVGRDLLQSH